ncbi:unnamed protein product [Brachionus calyciflorus]|uniref:Uncharacterized protein n=1 Tax=Brachionus calyciflorus TaxID=104777 RepID=A0A814IFA3_9BILA|nr:unnamed protein product [Brachionus calyciflorus]
MTQVVRGSNFKENFILSSKNKTKEKTNSFFKKSKFQSSIGESSDLRASLDLGNDTGNSSILNSCSSSVNELNYTDSEAYIAVDKTKTIEADNFINQIQINEIVNRLKNQANRMALKSKYSNVYKDIINSLLNENLISYSKQYESFLDEKSQVTRISHPQLEKNDKLNEQKLDKKPILKSRAKRNLSVGNIAQTVSKFTAPNRPSEMTSINEDKIDNPKKSRPSTKLSLTPRSSSSLSIHTSRLNDSRRYSNLEASDNSDQKIKITDLIFKDYFKTEENIREVNFKKEHDGAMKNVIDTNMPINYLTPSFKIQYFNLNEPKQLVLAKEDVLKRYAFINDSQKFSKNLSYSARSKLFSKSNKKAQ